MKLVKEHLAIMRQELLATTEQNFLVVFARTFVRYRHAVDVLCVGFRYMVYYRVYHLVYTIMLTPYAGKSLPQREAWNDISQSAAGCLHECRAQSAK